MVSPTTHSLDRLITNKHGQSRSPAPSPSHHERPFPLGAFFRDVSASATATLEALDPLVGFPAIVRPHVEMSGAEGIPHRLLMVADALNHLRRYTCRMIAP